MKSCYFVNWIINTFLFFSAFLFLGTSAHADPWTGKGELGYVQVSGNTESETLNAGIRLEKIHDKWKHVAKASAIRAAEDDEASSESYGASWRSEYSLSARSFTFGDIRYFDDKFDSFEEIYTISAGFGYKVFNREGLTWDLSAGIGYRDTAIESTQEDISSITYILESDYKQQLTESTTLENNTRAEIAHDNSFIQNVLGISISINSSLALKVSYDVRHNTQPEPGDVSTDKIFSTNIVYSF